MPRGERWTMVLHRLLPDVFVPTFALTVDHVPLGPPVSKQILELGVTQRLDPPNSFTFRLDDATLDLVAVTGGVFTEGTRVECSLGFTGETKRLIVGGVSSLTADFPADGPITVEVGGVSAPPPACPGAAGRV